MKIFMKCLAVVFGIAALAAAVFGIHTAMENRDALPVLVEPSQGALNAASEMLQAVEDGDYEKAGSLILGNPAKVVKTLSQEQIDYIHADAELYLKLANEYL